MLIHKTAQLRPELRLHYVTSGDGERTIVLLHGFPQTWKAWRFLFPALVPEGFCVGAPCYPGAGHSSRPASRYHKPKMATELPWLFGKHPRLLAPPYMVWEVLRPALGHA